ncbi:MAG: hydantoinase/oxoprolinase family protein [Proteobacteria bacterium]|nr:hydantoinase/oxoprolinase family protein [Pseudomonadota bacterium]
MPATEYVIGVDVGGTFTDFVGCKLGHGAIFNGKVLTTPDDPSEAVLSGLARMLSAHGIDPAAVRYVIHGTTLVANALIERKGVKTALITSKGFRDVLEIGREYRYDTYDLFIDMPRPLVPRNLRFEVDERMDREGRVVRPLDLHAAERLARELAASDVRAVAVAFLHAYRSAVHEREMQDILARFAPRLTVSLSSEVVPQIGEYERSSTTVANAYVKPIFETYVGRLSEGLRRLGIGRDLYLVLSDGGTVDRKTAAAHPVRLVHSGPAGGAQAAALYGRLGGADRVLAFDMGGTTAKACLIEEGRPNRTTEVEIARLARFKPGSGIPLRVPIVNMIEIGAGGGSIARVNSLGLVQVGPDSSGAKPGPACYALGGVEPTVTDADLVLGYLDAGSFLGGEMALDVAAARRALHDRVAAPLGLSVEEAALGVFQTVNEGMAQAAAIHALEQGKRIVDFALVAIGGAGPVHAWALARALGIGRLISPLGAGVASAFGFLAAPTAFEATRTRLTPLAAVEASGTRSLVDELAGHGLALLERSGESRAPARIDVFAAMRYVGQGYEVETPLPRELVESGDQDGLARRFEAAYRLLFGRTEVGFPVEIVSWRVIVSGPVPAIVPAIPEGLALVGKPAGKGVRAVYFAEAGGFVDTPVFNRYALEPGFSAEGPLVVEERESTLVVPPQSRLSIDASRNAIVAL